MAADHDARYGEKVNVDVAGDATSRSSYIEVPAPQRKVLRFARVHDERQRRLERLRQSVEETA